MATLETIKRITILAKAEGAAEAKAKLDRLAESQGGVAVSSEKARRATISLELSLDRIRSSYEENFAAGQKLVKVSRDIEMAQREGLITAEAGARLYAQAADKITGYSRELQKAARIALQFKEAEEAAAQAAAAHAQSTINGRLGVRDDFNTSSRAADIEAYAGQIDATRARLVPLAALQQEYKKQLDDIAQASRAGVITETERAEAIRRAKDAFAASVTSLRNGTKAAGDGARLTGMQVQNLSFQLNDMATMLASGASPFQVMATQGGQVYQALSMGPQGLGGSLKGLGNMFMGLLTPASAMVTALVGGAAAAIYSWDRYRTSLKEIELSLLGLGRGMNATAGQINTIAESAASAAGLSLTASRTMAAQFAATGKIGVENFNGLIEHAKAYALITGQDLPEATKELAKAFADPAKGAEMLGEKLGLLDDRTATYIRNLAAQGNGTQAQKALLDAMVPSLAGAEQKTSALARAWDSVKNAASNAIDSVGKALTGAVTAQDKLAELIQQRRKTAEGYTALTPRGQAAISYMDSQISFQQEDVRRQEQARVEEAAKAQAAATSKHVGEIVRNVLPDIERLEGLKNQAAYLQKALLDDRVLSSLAVSADQAKESLARLNARIENFQSAAQMAAEDNKLELAAINARTVEERAAIEAERARVGVMRTSADQAEAAVKAEGARNRVIAEANRQAQDALKSARDEAGLVGLKPLQRALKEQEYRDRDRREQLGTSSMPALSSGGAGGLDTSFDEKLKKLIDAVPGVSISSGYRSPERQAQLWDDALRKYGSLEAARKWVAPPGSSQHNAGLAADLRFANDNVRQEVHQRAAEFGLSFPLSNESWHVEPIGGRSRGRTVQHDDHATSSNDLLDQTSTTERSTIMRKFSEETLTQANEQLTQQIALTRRQAETFGMSTAEITKASEAQRLMNEYSKTGVNEASLGREAYAQLTANIAAYAERAGQAAAEVEALAERQKMLGEFSDMGKDSLKGFLADLKAGKSGAEAFSNALERLEDKLLDMAINSLFDSKGGGILSFLTGGSGGSPFSLGNLFSGGGSVPTMHSGGLVGHDATSWRNIHPAYFDDAPRFHSGLRPDEVPAILQRGEWVLSRDDVSAIRSGQSAAPAQASRPVVNVINHGPTEATAVENSDGSIDVIIDSIEGRMADRASRGKGALYKASSSRASGGGLMG